MSVADRLLEHGIRLRRERPGTRRLACPGCRKGRRDDALAVTLDGAGAALWFWHRCGFSGSARSESRQATAKPRAHPTPPPQRPARDWRPVWQESRPIAPGTVAATYLTGRACALPHPDGDLRWHPALRHPSGHIGPALVALVTHAATAGPMSVHRTWLKADGAGKAALDKPRLLWPGAPRTGGVVRLWPDEEVALGLAVGEGLETALSVVRGFGSAWACIDAGKLAAFPVLPGIDGLTIVADHDEAAMKAADACAARWHETWAEVRLWRARAPKADFNDWMLGRAD